MSKGNFSSVQLNINKSFITSVPGFVAKTNNFWQEILFEEFQDVYPGSQLGYQEGIILGILNLPVAMTRVGNFINRA